MATEPSVTRYGVLDMQVCVPADWTDEQIVQFAESTYPCGTSAGWRVRTQMEGVPEYQARVVCGSDDNKVHVVLDA